LAAIGQSSRLAVFGGRGMSFNVCRGSLAGQPGDVHTDEERLRRQEDEYRSPGARLT
jgi:hypothetical protein